MLCADMPLQVNLEWSRAQLGQITKLITGNDQGWRGEILLDLALTGTPARLHIAATSSMDDFRRYDLTSGKALRMGARCDADYSTDTHDFQQVMCSAPIGDGLLTLTGDAGFPGSHQYSLAVSADNIPAAALVSLAQRMKKNLPEDLAAEGILDGKLSARQRRTIPASIEGRRTDYRFASEFRIQQGRVRAGDSAVCCCLSFRAPRESQPPCWYSSFQWPAA